MFAFYQKWEPQKDEQVIAYGDINCASQLFCRHIKYLGIIILHSKMSILAQSFGAFSGQSVGPDALGPMVKQHRAEAFGGAGISP